MNIIAKATTGLSLALVLLLLATCVAKSGVERKLEASNKLAAERLTSLNRCSANVSELEASVAARNAAIEAARKEGQAALLAAQERTSTALKTAQAAERRAGAILSRKPVGYDACQRAMEVEDLILETLK